MIEVTETSEAKISQVIDNGFKIELKSIFDRICRIGRGLTDEEIKIKSQILIAYQSNYTTGAMSDAIEEFATAINMDGLFTEQ